jgi:hypothetical protein
MTFFLKQIFLQNLPYITGLAKSWDSNGRRFLIWFYFYLQQILGWILIPIALASIYSQLK